MFQRAITGALFVLVIIGAIIFSSITFVLLFFVIMVLGLLEFYTLAEKTEASPQKVTGVIAGVLLYAAVAFHFSTPFHTLSMCLFAGFITLLFTAFVVELYRKKENPFTNIAFTLLGAIYVALPFSLLCALAFGAGGALSSSYSPTIILGVLFILWSSDTGAYLAGITFGKNKLFERISPKKTWEGTIGGGILAIAIAYLLSFYFTDLTTIHWIVVALIIVCFGNLGDLVESLFKRSIDVKDSGSILPGHGGILDRFDSLLLSTPFIFIYLYISTKL